LEDYKFKFSILRVYHKKDEDTRRLQNPKLTYSSIKGQIQKVKWRD